MRTFDFRRKEMKNLRKLMCLQPYYERTLSKPTLDFIRSMRVGHAILEVKKNRKGRR